VAKSLRKSKAYIQRIYDREKIQSKMAPEGSNEFVLILDQLKAGYNVPKIYRSAQAFGCRKILSIGVGPFDPSPARGSFKQTQTEFPPAPGLDACEKLRQEGYEFWLLDPHADVSLFNVSFAQKSAFIFGHEEYGVSPELQALAGARRVRIPQWGKVESLNVSIAASLVMYEYLRQQKSES
jgi:tRNA G18 (ribose-2'-O)-methylase SpoU